MGKLLVIEGLDASGKGTQTKLTEEYLKTLGLCVKTIDFPDYSSRSSELVKLYLSGELSENLEDINAYAASSFYAVDRYASYISQWKKDYQKGDFILANRYSTSNATYQMSKISDNERDDFLTWLEDYEYNKLELPRPNAVIYLNMSINVVGKLLKKRYDGDENKKDIHEKNVDFLTKCSRSGLYAAEKLNWKVINCCDGENPLSVEEIQSQIRGIINNFL